MSVMGYFVRRDEAQGGGEPSEQMQVALEAIEELKRANPGQPVVVPARPTQGAREGQLETRRDVRRGEVCISWD